MALLLIASVAALHAPIGDSVPFDRSLQIFNLSPLPNFAPGVSNTKLAASTAGFLPTIGAFFIFSCEFAQALGPRGLPTYGLAVLLAAAVWYGLAILGEWRKPPIALICLLGFQLFGAAYYWSSFQTPARRLVTRLTAFDFHAHTTRSSGLLTPQQQIDWHRAHGFRGLAFTDSDTMVPLREFAALQAANPDMLLLNGCEYRGVLHLICLGIKSPVSAQKLDVPSAIREVKRQGGIVIVAHPWWPRNLLAAGQPLPLSLEGLADLGVAGFESWNGKIWSREIISFVRSHRLLTTTATDTLSKSGSRCYTWTLLPRGMDDAGDVIRALRLHKVAAAFALEDTDTPARYDALQKKLKSPRGITIATRAAWASLSRAQRLVTALSFVAIIALLWAWGAERGRKPIQLAGPQRVVGFLRRRRLISRAPGLLFMVMAWAGSIAAAIYCLSWTEKIHVSGLTPLHALAAWLLLDILYLYGQSLWHRAA